MAVEIESILGHDAVVALLDTAEQAGTVAQSELTEIIEAHEFDVFELDLLHAAADRALACSPRAG